MRPRLKINFTDFWVGFDKKANYLWDLLSNHYELEISDEPQVLFYSVFGQEFKKYKCLRIFFTGEFYEPNFKQADFALSFSYTTNPRNYRLPLYAVYFDIRTLLNKPDADTIIAQKNKFCCFVVSNKNCKRRNEFFKKLSKYKKVDSGGRFMNNIGGPVKDKFNFIKDYKFVISFENYSYPGYATEKIAEPMVANTIPIYWGDTLIHKEFNTKSFVNVADYNSDEEAIARIIEIDNNEQLYRKYLEEPWLPNNQANPNYFYENILKRLVEVIEKRDEVRLAATNKENMLEKAADRLRRKLRGERRFKSGN